jgi:hypothetical protein
MSADNGIYILETISEDELSEYRVKHLQGIDDYTWDDDINDYSANPNIHIKNARKMWENCEVFYDRSAAMAKAHEIYREIMDSDFPVLEYGIDFIYIPRRF